MAKGVKGSTPKDVPTRTTFIIKTSLIKKLKKIAALSETTQTAIVEGLLSDYIDKWEKKNGSLPVK